MAEQSKDIKIIQPQAGGQDAFVRSNVDICIFGGTLGGGKAQPYDAKVCTPFGFRNMGDLKVGDIVSRKNGQFQKVIAIYEKGEREVIEFEFADGRKVECCEEHLWNVRRAHARNKRFRKSGDYDDMWEVMTASQIMEYLDTHKSSIYIPNCGDVAFTKSVRGGRNIHPYLLGALLGDGCLVAKDCFPKLTSADPEMIEYIRSLGYDVVQRSYKEIEYKINDRGAYEELKRLKLLGHRSETKFVPYIYLHGSIEDRMSLLQGLLDTDGTIDNRGHIEFDSVSEQLAKDVQWLVWSFGGLCTMTTKQGSYKLPNGEKRICQKVYRLYIRLRSASRFFVLSRKKERAIDKIHIGNDNFETAIKSYKRTGVKKKMRCIRVSSPDSLYLTDNFVVTHNSFGAILANAEPSLDSNYRAVFFRRTLAELKTSGGIVDDFENAYGDMVTITKSENPRITFKGSGAWIECRQIADENPNKVRETYKGAQWDAAFFEELTGYQFYTWNYLASRVRGKAKWSGKVRATTNPSKTHWVRKLLAWWIGNDGFVIPERSGVVRYVYLDGNSVEDYVWGDSKYEVYQKCKRSIDEKLAKLNDDSITYENLVKSFTFILGNLAENKALLANNPDYVGNVSGKEGDALLSGNWNIDLTTEEHLPIDMRMARNISEQSPVRNGLKYVVADLADTGSNSTVICVFDGFHCIDAMILNKSTGKVNAEWMKKMARKHDIAESHIIYDAQRAEGYIVDYLPNAIPYYSYAPSRGIGRFEYKRRKDANYARLIDAINRGDFSISPTVANMVFERTKMGEITFLQKFVDECGVIQWADDSMTGKKRLLGKKEMISKLGRGDSTDICDSFHMLMSVYETVEFGDELNVGRKMIDEDSDSYAMDEVDIYDDSTWA